jgi:hypothetical protein
VSCPKDNFKKKERRFLLVCLENVQSNLTEDMLRWKSRWIRLGEKLHPGEYVHRLPKTFRAFDVLRNNKPFETFNSKAERLIPHGTATEVVELLSERPGDFARRLDHVLRSHGDHQAFISNGFAAVADKASTPVLLQAWAHFWNRDITSGRAFFPKGNAAKVQFKEKPLPPLRSLIGSANSHFIRAALVRRFSEMKPLGKVFIDERLRDQLVPFSQRSASRSLRSITRGSSFDLPPGNTVRFFCWWKNLSQKDYPLHTRVDLDLSSSLFGSDWECNGDVSYYNLRQGGSCHSGDITSAPKGACEFIDMNLSSVLEKGSRYIVMSVLSFTGQQFISLPECFGGWMMREKPQSGEIFEPKTVQDKIDITASSKACVPVIIDAQERKVYWTDLGLKSSSQINNAARNSVGFSQIGRAITTLKKPTLYDLFGIHAEARGEIVSSRDEADTVFGLHEGTVSAFDTDVILSEYLV